MFSPDFFQRYFCYSEHFVEKKKDGNHFMQRLVNMVEEVEKTSLNPAFFLVILVECIIREKNNVSPISEYRAFCWKIFMQLGVSYLPTPPLGQDMTLGQFLSGV